MNRPPVPSYPLHWPEGVPRTLSGLRRSSPFRTGYDAAVKNVVASIRLFAKDARTKIEHVVLSTSRDLLSDAPKDPGAAVWFYMDEQLVAFAVDRFYELAANVQAIHHIIEARRTELRYGGLAIVRQTFRGFIALPKPPAQAWRAVLGVSESASFDDAEAAFKRLAATAHPDRGGSTEAMARLNKARDEAKQEFRK